MAQVLKLLFILCIAATLSGCASAATPASPAVPEDSSSQIANPASENCIKQGGQLIIQKRGDGGEYAVCLFEDNRQCEEWALLRGDCRAGGAKITGYVTDAARYCVITGGKYTITVNTNPEQGNCTFAKGI